MLGEYGKKGKVGEINKHIKCNKRVEMVHEVFEGKEKFIQSEDKRHGWKMSPRHARNLPFLVVFIM